MQRGGTFVDVEFWTTGPSSTIPAPRMLLAGRWHGTQLPTERSHASFSENACTKSLNIARCECRGRPPSSEVACKQRQKTIVMPIRVTPPASAGWTAPPSALFVVEAGAQVHGNKIKLPGYHKGGLDIDEPSADFCTCPCVSTGVKASPSGDAASKAPDRINTRQTVPIQVPLQEPMRLTLVSLKRNRCQLVSRSPQQFLETNSRQSRRQAPLRQRA
jgi:hypothetical protein